jgi:hypothetical protein
VVDGAHLRRVGNLSGLPVPHESIRLYAAPQLAAYVDELLETVVAAFMVDQFVVAVIGIVGPPLGGDDVKRNTTVGDMIERVEQPRCVKRMHKRRSVGEAETEVVCHSRHRSDPRAHIQAWPGDAVAHGVVDGRAPSTRDAGGIPEEDHIDAATFRCTSHFLEHADVWMMPVDPRARISPLGLDRGPREIEC